jgi:hypothetical protein
MRGNGLPGKPPAAGVGARGYGSEGMQTHPDAGDAGPHPFSGPSGRLITYRLNLLVLKSGCVVNGRRLVVQGRVGPLHMVLYPPGLNGRPRFAERDEPMLVSALLPQSGIERFNEGVVGRRPWSAEGPCDTAAMRPRIQRLRSELRPIINQEGPRQTACTRQLLEHSHHARAAQGEVYLNGRTLTGHVLDSREGAESPPIGQAISDAIETPVLIRGTGDRRHHA